MSLRAPYQTLLQYVGDWDDETSYFPRQIIAVQLVYWAMPIVSYSGKDYFMNNTILPTLAMTPDTDTAWSEMGESSSNILATALTGFAAASGTPTSASTILQAFNYLSYPTYLLLTGLSIATVADGALSLTAAATSKSSNITVNATTVSLPLNKTFQMEIILNVTTGLTSGSTFTITGTNCTVVGQAKSVGASITAQDIILVATVVTTGTASPTASAVASATTGTVAVNDISTLSLTGLN